MAAFKTLLLGRKTKGDFARRFYSSLQVSKRTFCRKFQYEREGLTDSSRVNH